MGESQAPGCSHTIRRGYPLTKVADPHLMYAGPDRPRRFHSTGVSPRRRCRGNSRGGCHATSQVLGGPAYVELFQAASGSSAPSARRRSRLAANRRRRGLPLRACPALFWRWGCKRHANSNSAIGVTRRWSPARLALPLQRHGQGLVVRETRIAMARRMRGGSSSGRPWLGGRGSCGDRRRVPRGSPRTRKSPRLAWR